MNDLDKERQTEGRKAWYAVQTFYCKEEHLGKYLEKKGVNYFIPMRYIEHFCLFVTGVHGGVMRFQTVRCWNSVPYAILIIKELFMSIQ